MTDTQQIERVAKRFAAILGQWLTMEELSIAVYRNEHKYAKDICASHDFCDANMAMEQAFLDLDITSPIDFPSDSTERIAAFDLWNAAWDMAKENNFYILDPIDVCCCCETIIEGEIIHRAKGNYCRDCAENHLRDAE